MGPVASDLSYTQFAQLPHILNKAENTPEQLRDAAQHFESLFIDMWLKAAREANESISTDNFLNSNEMKMHQQMLDHEMSVHMASNGGIGLADVIVRQLSGHAPSQVSTADTSGAVRPTSGRTQVFDTPQAFVDEIKPIVENALKNVSLPIDGILGQAALETGWGNSVITAGDGALSHNLFGIKAKSADEPSVPVSSMEFELGRWVNRLASFRSYPDWQASVEDYIETLKSNPRYSLVLEAGTNVESFAKHMGDSGYATDPNYAAKLADISKRIGMM